MKGTVLRALLVSALIGGAALAGIVVWLGPEDLSAIRSISVGWLAAAVAIFAASFVLAGLRLTMLVTRTGTTLALHRAVRAHLLGLFASTVTPGGSGGMPALAMVLERQGIERGKAWSAAVTAMTADTVFYGWSIPIALVVLNRTGTLPDRAGLQTVAIFVSVAALVVAYLLTFQLRWTLPLARSLLRARLARFRTPVVRFLGELLAAKRDLNVASWRWHLRFHLLVAASWCTFFLVLWASARGFGLTTDPVPLIAAMAVVTGTGSVFPTPGGSGYFEFGASLALIAQGGQSGIAPAVLVWRLISHYGLFVLGPMLGGYVVTRTPPENGEAAGTPPNPPGGGSRPGGTTTPRR